SESEGAADAHVHGDQARAGEGVTRNEIHSLTGHIAYEVAEGCRDQSLAGQELSGVDGRARIALGVAIDVAAQREVVRRAGLQRYERVESQAERSGYGAEDQQPVTPLEVRTAPVLREVIGIGRRTGQIVGVVQGVIPGQRNITRYARIEVNHQ